MIIEQDIKGLKEYREEMIEQDIKRIADYYGPRSQMGVCQEECAELIQAISKWYRDKANFNNLYEEIADVEIMLTQIKHLLNCNLEVDMWKQKKIERTMERIMFEGIKRND